MEQQDSRQFNRMMALAHSNHLWAEFLLGWIAMPASEERCEQACAILLATIKLAGQDPDELLTNVTRAWTQE